MIGNKILYASAHPFVDFHQALETYAKLDFKPEVRRKIMHDNAARLLGLTPPPVTADAVHPPQLNELVSDIVREVMGRLN